MEIHPKKLQRSKKPLFTFVYDKLYKLITDGTFPPNSQLPSEPELAKLFDVSRMTLRQALSLLRDDGLINNVHGKGNFITKTHHVQQAAGLEVLGNPLYKCHTMKTIDHVDLTYRMEVTSDYSREVLERDTDAVVICERWYHSGTYTVAYALSMMAFDAVKKLNIDLGDEDQLLDMLETGIYEHANSQIIDLKHSFSAKAPSQKYHIHKGNQFALLTDKLYISDKHPTIHNKYYIPMDYFHLKINVRP